MGELIPFKRRDQNRQDERPLSEPSDIFSVERMLDRMGYNGAELTAEVHDVLRTMWINDVLSELQGSVLERNVNDRQAGLQAYSDGALKVMAAIATKADIKARPAFYEALLRELQCREKK